LTASTTFASVALLYAWNPLAVLEVAGSGYVDAAAATAIVVALLAERKGHPALAGALLGAAALLKLFPLVLLAALTKRDLGRAVPAALVVVVVGYLPFIVTGARPAGYVGKYVADQDVNAVFYVPAHLASGIGLRHALHALPLMALLAVLTAIVWRRWWGGLTMETTALLLLLAILLFSPSMYAWYLLTVLPFLPLGLHAARRVQRRTPRGGVATWKRSMIWPALYMAPLLFSGTVILEYTFTTGGIPVWWVGVIEYLPLYIPLAAATYGETAPWITRLRDTLKPRRGRGRTVARERA